MSPRTRKRNGNGQKPQAVPGRYGEGQAQLEAQKAIPLPQTPPAPTAPVRAPPAPAQPLGPFNAPTARPNEPVTAGLPVGPGPGPAVNAYTDEDDLVAVFTAMHQAYPSEETAGLLEEAMIRRGEL